MHTSHESPQPSSRSTKAKTYLAASALALASGSVGTAVASKFGETPTGVSREETHAIANEAAYHAVRAEALADYYTEQARKLSGTTESLGQMQFLNGVVESPNAVTGPTVHQDLIILTLKHWGNPEDAYDADGKFLDGSYLGVASSDENGYVRVTVIPYDSSENKFVPYDRSEPVITARAYLEQTQKNDYLYVGNALNEPIRHADGSPYSPSLVK